MTRSPTLSAWCTVNAPACRSIASTRVVLPWSTCATIATLRRLAVFSSGTRVDFTVPEPPDPHPRAASGGSGGQATALHGEDGCWPTAHLCMTVAHPPLPRQRVAGRGYRGGMPSIATNTRVEREQLLDFVRTRHHLILVTRRADGSPQLSPVAGGVDADGRIVISTYPDRAKATNLRRDPRASVLVLSDEWNDAWVQVDGDRRGPRHAQPGGRGGAGRLLPLHLRRAPRLGGVPRGDEEAGQVAGPDHARALGPGRHRRLPAPTACRADARPASSRPTSSARSRIGAGRRRPSGWSEMLAHDDGVRLPARPSVTDAAARRGRRGWCTPPATAAALPGDLVRTAGDGPSGDVAVDEAADGVAASLRDVRRGLRPRLLRRRRRHRRSRRSTTSATTTTRSGTAQQLVFGDGDGQIFDRFTKPVDVLGHELTHAVTERTAGLVYEGQSGALNESLSDVFAACLKQRLLGQEAVAGDWLIGAGLFLPGVQARALRDMAHPGTAYDDPVLGQDPQPGHMDGYVDTTDDHGGVHLNSGIPNRAFQLAATAIGGSSAEGAGRIWYAALTGGLSSRADFAGFAAATVAAAGEHADAVEQAWRTVGVTPRRSARRARPAAAGHRRPTTGRCGCGVRAASPGWSPTARSTSTPTSGRGPELAELARPHRPARGRRRRPQAGHVRLRLRPLRRPRHRPRAAPHRRPPPGRRPRPGRRTSG